MREIRFKMRASSVPIVSVQERAMSTDIVRTTDTAVQLDNAGLEMVDKSQQMSELPSLYTELKVGATVHKLIQKAKSQQVPASTSEQQDKRVVEGSFGSRQVSRKEDKIQKRDKFDEASSKEAQRIKPNKIPERRLSFLKRMFPGSSASKTHTSVSKERPPVPLPAQMITERTLKAGDVSRTSEVKPTDVSKKDTRNLKSKLPTTLSQKAGESSSVPTEPTRIPAFKDVLQELVKHYAEKQASKALIENVARKEVAEKTSSRFMGLGLAVPATMTPLSLTSKTDTLQKGSVRQNPFLLKDLETMKSPSPPMSPRFYTRTVDDSDMLCPTVQGFIHARESRRVASRARIDDLRRRVESVAEAPTGSPNFATTTIAEETEVPVAKGFPRPHANVQVEKKHVQRAEREIACRPQSSCQAITTVGNKPFKVCPWGDSFSATDETPSVESRMEGNVPRNSQPAQILSLKQELEAADPSAGLNLEQTFMAPRIDANWSITTPEAVLGSMDVESSETSVGGLRATVKRSVNVASQIIVPYEQDTRVIPALKSKKGKWNKGKKKVNFQEKPFTDVLAEIEDDYEEFEKKAASRQDDFNVRADNDSVAEASVKSSASEEDDDGTGYAFVEYCAEAAKERGIEHPGKEPIEAQTRLPLAQGEAGHNTRLAIQQSSFQIYQMMQGGNLIELATSSRHLSVTPSRTVSHPFCRSDEGPLLPSASTTLSFLSSDSNVSVGHRATDLTCLHALTELAAPYEEIGDGKSQSGVANLPVTRKPEPPAPLELHHRQLEPQLHPRQQYQAGEHPPQQQCQGKLRPSPSQSPSGEEKSARSSRRSRMLEQARCQDGVENRSARPPKRPNTGDRQRMGRFTAKERRWGDDILRVIMMGNKHYLRERSLSTPRPRSASIIGAAPLLDETQYITQQIEQTHAAVSDADHACPSPELRQAALTAQVVATEVRSQDSSAGAVSGLVQPWTDQRVLSPTSPSGQMSPRSSQRMCSRPPSSLVSPDPHGARHVTWGPGGEQRKMDTIAEAVCEIELKDPQAVMGALALKVSELETAGDVFSGDSLAKSPIQVVVVDDNENLAPSLASGLGTESRLTPICPQWDVCERDLMASVKMLSAAVGTPESFEKSIELPSPEGLLMSETSTMPSRVDTVGLSSVGGSVVLDACASALSYTRTGSSKNVRSRRLSTKLLEGPCFESIYNSILQPGSSPVVSLSIPGLGSQDFTAFYGPRHRLSGPTFEQSTFSCRTDGSKIDAGSADAATTSGSASFVPDTQEHGGFDEVHARRRVDTTAIRSQEPMNSMPPPTDRPRRRSGSRRSGSRRRASQNPRSGTLSRQVSSAALPEGSVVEVIATESKGRPAAVDVDSEEDRSSFFSFEESVSETSLVPDATNLDWSATSYASRSRSDIA
ncbi:uncharacterized protein LOC142777340 [Rhipicephalus microplus]|uniref:uncharacterized protein LOC142777340 n=1 Tax=Rhipicephalus microplus TaxID=6941 RepID=UPI003F6A9B25